MITTVLRRQHVYTLGYVHVCVCVCVCVKIAHASCGLIGVWMIHFGQSIQWHVTGLPTISSICVCAFLLYFVYWWHPPMHKEWKPILNCLDIKILMCMILVVICHWMRDWAGVLGWAISFAWSPSSPCEDHRCGSSSSDGPKRCTAPIQPPNGLRKQAKFDVTNEWGQFVYRL